MQASDKQLTKFVESLHDSCFSFFIIDATNFQIVVKISTLSHTTSVHILNKH